MTDKELNERINNACATALSSLEDKAEKPLEPESPIEMMYDDYCFYDSMFITLERADYPLSEFITDKEGNKLKGAELVQYLFKLHTGKEISPEQADAFKPFLYFESITNSGGGTDDEPDNQLDIDIKNLFENQDFWENIKAMYDYYTAIEPYLLQELDKLYDLRPDIKEDNWVTLNNLKALLFVYRDFPDEELEPFFEKCRHSRPKKIYMQHIIPFVLTYYSYFEYIYKAVKAAFKAAEKAKQTKQKKERTSRSKQQTFTQIQENGLEKLNKIKASIIPSSPSVDFIYRIFIAGKSGLREMQERLKNQSHGKKEVTIDRDGQTREITQTTAKGQDTIILDVDHLLESRQNSPARKILLYFLSQILQQALSNNNVIRDGVIISYQDMVDKGMYNTTQTAKRGLDRAFDLLSTIKIKGYIIRGKRKIEQVKASLLFYDLEHTGKGNAILMINDTLNWGYIVPQYALLPDAYYELPPNAADLYYYIFNQARINIKNVTKKGGKINISYKSIHTLLGLAAIDDASNPTVQIKNPIENAIGAISDSKQDALYIETTSPTEYTNIHDYLERGYITAVINPEYMECYIEKVK